MTRKQATCAARCHRPRRCLHFWTLISCVVDTLETLCLSHVFTPTLYIFPLPPLTHPQHAPGPNAGVGVGAGQAPGATSAPAPGAPHHACRSELSAPVVVSLRRACFSSGNRFRNIELRNINLTVRQGDIVFIMGSKGSGKSALLELIRY